MDDYKRGYSDCLKQLEERVEAINTMDYWVFSTSSGLYIKKDILKIIKEEEDKLNK